VPLEADGTVHWKHLDAHAAQDMAAWISQGPVMDRTKELLGESDKGIRLLRQMFIEQARIVAAGGEPMNVFRDPEQAKNIHIPHIDEEDYWSYQKTQLLSRARTANKWSPVLTEMIHKYYGDQAEEILKDPVH